MNQLELMEVLARIPLFKNLSAVERHELQKMTRNTKKVAAGDFVVREGKDSPFFYIILSGEGDVLKGQRKVNSVKPGDFVGEVAFICKEPRSASVKARTTMALLYINIDDFNHLSCRIRESIKDKIIQGLVTRINGLNQANLKLEDEVNKLKR